MAQFLYELLHGQSVQLTTPPLPNSPFPWCLLAALAGVTSAIVGGRSLITCWSQFVVFLAIGSLVSNVPLQIIIQFPQYGHREHKSLKPNH